MFANNIQHTETPMESELHTFVFCVIIFANWTKILKQICLSWIILWNRQVGFDCVAYKGLCPSRPLSKCQSERELFCLWWAYCAREYMRCVTDCITVSLRCLSWWSVDYRCRAEKKESGPSDSSNDTLLILTAPVPGISLFISCHIFPQTTCK